MILPAVSWEYIGEELAVFWESPYGRGKEKIATFWWPIHPPENTHDVERQFEAIATCLVEAWSDKRGIMTLPQQSPARGPDGTRASKQKENP